MKPEDVALMDALLNESAAASLDVKQAEEVAQRARDLEKSADKRTRIARDAIEYLVRRMHLQRLGKGGVVPYLDAPSYVQELFARLGFKGEA